MTDHTDLIARLRLQRDHADDWRTDLAERAADALEAQGRRLAETERDLRDAQKRLNVRADKIMAAEKRLAEAEARIESLLLNGRLRETARANAERALTEAEVLTMMREIES